jgi:hypothetical protein
MAGGGFATMPRNETDGVACTPVATDQQSSAADYREEDFELAPEQIALEHGTYELPPALLTLSETVSRGRRDLAALVRLTDEYGIKVEINEIESRVVGRTLDNLKDLLRFYTS